MKQVVFCRNECVRMIDRACAQLGVAFDKPQLLSISRYRPPKTNEQNAKMHAMWRELANNVGYTEADIKSYFKEEYGPTIKIEIGDSWKMVRKSVSEYTKMDCMEMIEHIYRVGAEAGYTWEYDEPTA